MNANLDTMPPRLREGALTDDDRMLYLMDEISRGARRAYDARIAKIGLNQTVVAPTERIRGRAA